MLNFSIEKNINKFSLRSELNFDNETMVLLAPSGGGKSLTLNCLSGIVKPDNGEIKLLDKIIYSSSKNINTPIKDRNIGYIFQDYALFPHKTVKQNIEFGIKENSSIREFVDDLIDKFGLRNKLNDFPTGLSGGEKQRIAILRAIASEPNMLLFDEPLSALDVQLKENLLIEIKEIINNLDIPILYVTHNFREAEFLASKISIMNNGKIVETGNKEDIFMNPKNVFTANFLGVKNIFSIKKFDISEDKILVKLDNNIEVTVKNIYFKDLSNCFLCINPKDVRLHINESKKDNLFKAVIKGMRLLERNYRVKLKIISDNETQSDIFIYMDIEELTCNKYSLKLEDIVEISLRADRIFICEE